MDEIDLAKFNFDIDPLLKSAARLKKEISDIVQDQKDLKEIGQENSVQFIKNEADIRSLRAEYNKHVKMLAETNDQMAKTANRSEMIALALNAESKSIQDARDQNKLLNELRNTANLLTAEGTDELNRLNAKLDENNAFIKENVDAYAKQKINIGNYEESIKSALDGMQMFNGSITDITMNFVNYVSTVQDAGGATAVFQGAMSGAVQGVKNFTKASIAFIATPIGAVLIAIGAAVALISNAMNRSEESTNKLKRAFSAFSGILSLVTKALEPLGVLLIDGIVAGFELAEQAAMGAIRTFGNVARALGFDTIANNVDSFADSVEEATAGARALVDAEQALTEARREGRMMQLNYQKEAEALRQIRDDERVSMTDRIAANKQLGAVLQQQMQDELRLAQVALQVANLRIEQEGRTKEALDAQAEALTEIADIEERIFSQTSEQRVNEVSLMKEAEDKRMEIIDKRLAKQQEEIDLFIAQQGIRARTLEEELEMEREVSSKRLALLQQELANKKISQEAYATQVLQIQQELARREAELAVDNAERELTILREQFDREKEMRQFLSEEAANLQKAQNDRLLEEQREFHELQLQQGLINSQEYADAIREVEEANRIANLEIDREREAVEREEAMAFQAIQFEQEMAALRERNATELEIRAEQFEQQRILEQQAIQQRYEDGLISKELYEAQLAELDRKAKEEELEREKILAEQKLDIATGLMDAAAAVINKESAVGKSIALAQALINTYRGISAGVALGFPQAIPAVAYAAATGFKAVKDITSTKIPSVGGGNAAGNAGKMNITSLGGVGTNLQPASGNAVVQRDVQSSVNMENLMDDVKRGVAEGAREGTAEGSQKGIIELSDNRKIINDSVF